MQKLTVNLSRFESAKKKGPTSERAAVLEEIIFEINKERIGTKYKPVKPGQIAVKLAHIKGTSDLYFILSQGRDYKKRHGSFSKYFFGAIKPK